MAESAVVASPDEVRGEIVKAFVILAPGYTPSDQLAEELQEYVKKVTAPYKYLREIEFDGDQTKQHVDVRPHLPVILRTNRQETLRSRVRWMSL